MSKALQDILGYTNLTGLIQATVTGVPDVFPPAFLTTKKTTIADSGRYTQVTGTRQTARLAMYGSPAVKRQLKDIASKDVKLLHTFEQITMDPLILQQLRDYDSYNVQQMGMQEVTRQMGEFRMYFDNLRKASLASALFLGKIYFDASGNLLPSSSGAVVTVDFGVPAGHQGQLDVFGTGPIISGSWAATTDIPGQLRTLKQAARRKTGYPLKYALYGKQIPFYLTGNTLVQQYLSRNPATHQKWLDTGELPDRLFDLTWVPAYEAFFEDQNNAFQSYVGDDAITFCPEVSQDWYELMEGTYMVPSSFNASANMATALGTLAQVTGMFAYAVPTHNPPSVDMFHGDTFLPIIKVPTAIFQADITP